MKRKGRLYKHFSKRLFAVEILHVHTVFSGRCWLVKFPVACYRLPSRQSHTHNFAQVLAEKKKKNKGQLTGILMHQFSYFLKSYGL